jgi:hypothetical protein
MDNSIWVAVAGILGTLGGTLGGVWLSNFLQDRHLKQQREWNFQDQKREWIRKRKQEMFRKILEFIEGSLIYIFNAKYIIQFGTEEQKDELLIKYYEQSTHAMTLIPEIINEDKELTEITNKFVSSFEGIDKIIEAGDMKISEKEKDLVIIAGKIQQRITKLLEKTFD